MFLNTLSSACMTAGSIKRSRMAITLIRIVSICVPCQMFYTLKLQKSTPMPYPQQFKCLLRHIRFTSTAVIQTFHLIERCWLIGCGQVINHRLQIVKMFNPGILLLDELQNDFLSGQIQSVCLQRSCGLIAIRKSYENLLDTLHFVDGLLVGVRSHHFDNLR